MSEDEQNKAFMKYFTEFCHFNRPQLTYILEGRNRPRHHPCIQLESDGPEPAAPAQLPSRSSFPPI
jgi:hypothetical protein